MRLSPRKIKYLTEKLVGLMREREGIFITGDEEELARIIGWEIEEYLKIEEEIDDEVDAVLDQYERQIMSGDMDQNVLRRKLKAELAKKRGYTL